MAKLNKSRGERESCGGERYASEAIRSKDVRAIVKVRWLLLLYYVYCVGIRVTILFFAVTVAMCSSHCGSKAK